MGSFIKAANALNVPRASVSAAIQQLENRLGSRLLHRTTRRVSLSADGEQLLEQLRPLLAELESIAQLFQGDQQVTGQLRVDVPSRIARRLIAPALPSLLNEHPHLQLLLGSSDRSVDLVQEGIDCVVRVGQLQNNSLVVRPLGELELVNCASPAYLATQGVPVVPDDLLSGHWMVGYAASSSGKELPWEYVSADAVEHTLAVPSRVITNNAENYIACCLAGSGLIQVPRFDVQQLLDEGRLVEVLPAFRPAPMPISLLYPHRRQRSRRLIIFLEWFEDLIKPYLL